MPDVATSPRNGPTTPATNIRLRLLDAGFPPVPAQGKVPGINGYPSFVRRPPAERTVIQWEKVRPNHLNTGIVCGHVRVIDLDVDDPNLASQCMRTISSSMGPDLPCRIGRWPRVALFCRSDDPTKITRRHKFARGAIEFLGYKTHVIVDGMHPVTGKAYYWLKEPLWEIPAEHLPVLGEADEATIVSLIGALLGGGSPPIPSHGPSCGVPTTLNSTPIPVGERNNALFPLILAEARTCTTEAELMNRASSLNATRCAVPVSVSEIQRKVRWVWGRKSAGQLWPGGGEARAILTQTEWAKLGPDAVYLLQGLRLAHGAQPGKLFAVSARAMVARFKMGVPRIVAARKRLIDEGLLEQVGQRGYKGHPTRFRLSPRR